jgi:predicted DNA-binding transcriptional regulator YafY
MDTQKLIKVELTEEQAQSLVELLDLATKTGGLQAARHALPLVEKVMASVPSKEEENDG